MRQRCSGGAVSSLRLHASERCRGGGEHGVVRLAVLGSRGRADGGRDLPEPFAELVDAHGGAQAFAGGTAVFRVRADENHHESIGAARDEVVVAENVARHLRERRKRELICRENGSRRSRLIDFGHEYRHRLTRCGGSDGDVSRRDELVR